MVPDNQPNPGIQRSVWSSLAVIGCVVCFIPFLIASVIVLSLIPVYLNRRNIQPSSSTSTPSLSTTYLVRNGDASSITSLNNIDQTKTSQSFAQSLGLADSNSIQVESLSQDTVIGSSRRKRFIRCDRGLTNVNGTGLNFQFNLLYPSHLVCQSDECKNNFFAEIRQRFEIVTELSVELAGLIIELQLCSLGIISFNPSGSGVTTNNNIPSTSVASANVASTSVASTTVASTSVTSTNIPSTSISSTSILNTNIPNTNIWQLVDNMSSARYQPTTTLASGGNSVVISGSSSIYNFPSTSVSTIDIFAGNGSLISSSNMLIARNFHTTNHLSSSNLILFAGGINAANGTKLNNAELFDITTGTATLITMSSIRLDHRSAAVNSSNKIILIGGTDENGTVSNTGDVFDGSKFTQVSNKMNNGRRYHTVTYLPTINMILIVGGETIIDCETVILDTVELYNIEANVFESIDNVLMSSPRYLHTATYIPSPYNQVLILGGSSNGTDTLNTYEIFDVSTLSFIGHGSIQSPRAAHTATLLTDDITVLILGGYSSNEAVDVSNQPIAACEIFNMTTTSSTTVANMNVPRAFHTAVLLPNMDDVLSCGGVNSNNAALASCERFIL